MPSLQIGKRYVRRDGTISGTIVNSTSRNYFQEDYPFMDSTLLFTYREDGLMYGPDIESELDLISLYTEDNKMERANRDNKGKIDLTLLPSVACYQEAKVWGYGEQKYGRHNWLKLWGEDTYNVALASLLRHAFAVKDGELFDKESGLPHAALIRCNAAMILEYMDRKGLLTTSAEDK